MIGIETVNNLIISNASFEKHTKAQQETSFLTTFSPSKKAAFRKFAAENRVFLSLPDKLEERSWEEIFVLIGSNAFSTSPV